MVFPHLYQGQWQLSEAPTYTWGWKILSFCRDEYRADHGNEHGYQVQLQIVSGTNRKATLLFNSLPAEKKILERGKNNVKTSTKDE